VTGRIGQIEGQELWLRCPFCGDSDNDPTKCHLSINLSKWLYHCYRCGAGGRLSTKEMLDILETASVHLNFDFIDILEDQEGGEQLPDLIPGAGSNRPSLLSRFHIKREGSSWDGFRMRDISSGDLIGVHTRVQGLKANIGSAGVDWVGNSLPVSGPSDPLILVEGPYDVVDPRCVSVFGIISVGKIALFKGHFVSLCPDGDVWQKRDLLRNFVATLDRIEHSPRSPVVMGVYYLPDGLDPDEGWKKRKYISAELLLDFLITELGEETPQIAKSNGGTYEH